jgi:hypothetical protein
MGFPRGLKNSISAKRRPPVGLMRYGLAGQLEGISNRNLKDPGCWHDADNISDT